MKRKDGERMVKVDSTPKKKCLRVLTEKIVQVEEGESHEVIEWGSLPPTATPAGSY